MADRNHWRVEPDSGFAESDPLAELSRLMGLDAKKHPAPRPAEDLGIDLERELLGELEASLENDNRPVAPAPLPPHPAQRLYEAFGAPRERTAAPDPQDSQVGQADDFDVSLAASLEEEMAAADDWRSDSDWRIEDRQADADIDLDFSGQLSTATPGNAAEESLTRSRPAHAQEDDDLGLEAELNMLLGTLGKAEDKGQGEATPPAHHDGRNAAEAVRKPDLWTGDADTEEPLISEAPESAWSNPAADRPLDPVDELHINYGVRHAGRLGLALPEADRDEGSATADDHRYIPEAAFYDDGEERSDLDDVVAGEIESISSDAGFENEFEPLSDEGVDFGADVDGGAVQAGGGEAMAKDEAPFDPFAELATMGLGRAAVPTAEVAPARQPERPVAPVEPSFASQAQPAAEAKVAEVPRAIEIETVEVPESVVALPDDLELPSFKYESEPAPTPAFDDFDADFADLLSDLGAAPTETPAEAPAASDNPEDDEFDAGFDRLFTQDAADLEEDHQPKLLNGAGASHSLDGGSVPHASPTAHAPLFPVTGFDDETQALGFDPTQGEEIAPTAAAAPAPLAGKRRLMFGAAIACVALVGTVAVGAYIVNSGDSDEPPAIVRADNRPVKVKPENPGGVVVPNQDNKVYERVAEGPLDAPSQEKLISGAEEPLEIAAPAAGTARPGPEAVVPEPAAATSAAAADAPDALAALKADPDAPPVAEVAAPADALPGVDLNPIEAAPAVSQAPEPKAEDRIEPTDEVAGLLANEEVIAVTPRRVRTMIVRPDGTLVPREEPEPAPVEVAPTQQPASAPEQAAAPAPAEAEAAAASQSPLAPVAAPAEPAPAVEKPAETVVASAAPVAQGATVSDAMPAVEAAASAVPSPAAAAAPEIRSPGDPKTPARAPIAPPRPGDQPVEIVGQVGAPRAQQVAAAVEPQPAAAPAVPQAAPAPGGWSMQIASQPSEANARQTYVDLASRYGDVLRGRSFNIVKAEIPNKGTYWRVRIPAESRSDAAQLCEKYKAAGGSCFVTQ